MPDIVVRILGPADAALFLEVRLEGLHLHPDAFGISAEEERAVTDDELARRLYPPPSNAIFGAFEGDLLMGIVGMYVLPRIKQRHRAHVWGMYVRPHGRRWGIGAALMRALIDHARASPGIETVLLSVSLGNVAAQRLYDALGFVPFCIDPRVLRLGSGQYVDVEMRALTLL